MSSTTYLTHGERRTLAKRAAEARKKNPTPFAAAIKAKRKKEARR